VKRIRIDSILEIELSLPNPKYLHQNDKPSTNPEKEDDSRGKSDRRPQIDHGFIES
jgi:hypothetical protein